MLTLLLLATAVSILADALSLLMLPRWEAAVSAAIPAWVEARTSTWTRSRRVH